MKRRLATIYDEQYVEETSARTAETPETTQAFSTVEYYASKHCLSSNTDSIDGYMSRQTAKRNLAIANELHIYGEMPAENISSKNLLQWWQLASNKVPLIATLARFIFSIPASSAGVESQFSTTGTGGIVTNRRNALSKSNVENILIVYDNRDIREDLMDN